MVSTLHQKVVAELVSNGARTVGFKKSVHAAAEDQLDLRWVRIVPDAYEVSTGLVIAYEVEDTHRVDQSKMRAYAKLWAHLDEIGWEMRLVIVDIRGGRVEPNLSNVYYHP